MKKAINLLGWISVTATMLALIFTMVSTYHFAYIKYFYGYYTLQWCLSATMILWGIKILYIKSSIKDVIYTIICFSMAFVAVFFRFMKVN
ncbi:hypothetical protein [Candidatus Clostridium stratigraminis]|uniref:Uncharacterized protein n=1 Tax=Candidatus Clostridium stratigraminis TaxID=3381661 RepID=A0ABW8T2Z0_9CLOT